MKSTTVRMLAPELYAALKQAARQRGKSVNQLVLELLRKELGLDKKKRFPVLHHDMDHLFGRWDEEEFRQIQKKLEAQRKVDEELWC